MRGDTEPVSGASIVQVARDWQHKAFRGGALQSWALIDGGWGELQRATWIILLLRYSSKCLPMLTNLSLKGRRYGDLGSAALPPV